MDLLWTQKCQNLYQGILYIEHPGLQGLDLLVLNGLVAGDVPWFFVLLGREMGLHWDLWMGQPAAALGLGLWLGIALGVDLGSQAALLLLQHHLDKMEQLEVIQLRRPFVCLQHALQLAWLLVPNLQKFLPYMAFPKRHNGVALILEGESFERFQFVAQDGFLNLSLNPSKAVGQHHGNSFRNRMLWIGH